MFDLNFSLRVATRKDLPALQTIEQVCFGQDAFNQRIFYYLLTKAKSLIFLAENDNEVQGYYMLLFRQGSLTARLYSIAVIAHNQGSGLAKILLEHAEQQAQQRACRKMVLEVRADNLRAQRFYQKMHYQQFGVYENYYHDHSAALRFCKAL